MTMEVHKMLNIIKLNLYRLFHQKAFYIVPISMGIVCFIMIYLVWLTPRMENQAAQITTESGFHIAMVSGSPDSELLPITEDFNLTEFMDELFGSGILMILISISAAIITNAEQKNGFIKNIAGQISPRGILPLAKLPGMLLECFLIITVAVLSCALSGKLLYANFIPGNLSGLARALAGQLLLGFALCSLILMICTLARNAASGIITGIVLATGMISLVYGLLNKVLWNYLHVPESFDITRFSLSSHFMSLTSASGSDALGLALAVGAVYLTACSLGAFMIIKKKDIA